MAGDRTKETALWGWLKSSLPRVSLPHDVQRIEDTTKSGTPDVEGCIGGGCFWAELKVAYEQPTLGTVRVKTTVHQVYRALRRTRAGGRSWYLIRVGTGKSMRHFLVPGSYAEELLDKPISLERLTSVSVVPPDARPEAILEAAARV